MRTCTTIVLLLVLVSPAVADEPERVTWSGRSGMTERWMTSRSAVTLTDGHLTGFVLSIDRRLLTIHVPGPLPVLDIAAEVGFGRGSADGTTFDQLSNNVSTWELTAGARARLPIVSWLHLQARAALGAGKARTEIASMSQPGIAIADGGGIAVASTGIGLALLPRLTSRDRAGFWWGLEAELGYHTSTATEVTAMPQDRASEELTIPAIYASLGDLDLDGTTLTLAVTLGF